MNQKQLEARIEILSEKLAELHGLLQQSYSYAERDAQSSLGKCRNVLEHTVRSILEKHDIPFLQHSTLNEQIRLLKESGNVPDRIIAKMHSTRVMANLAVHGKKVTPSDALSALNGLCDILEWQNEIKYDKREKRPWLFWLGISLAILLLGVFYLNINKKATPELENRNPIDPTQTAPRADENLFNLRDIESFVEEFQHISTTPDVNGVMSFYAEYVKYENEVIERYQVEKKWVKFINKWPVREYDITDESIKIRKIGTNQFYVYYDETYTAKHPDKPDSKGIYRTELVVQVVGRELKITEKNGSNLAKNFSVENAKERAKEFQVACAENNIDNILSFYTRNVNYFDKGYRSHSFIRKDIIEQIERWPTRVYYIDGNIDASEVEENHFRVTYVEKYTALHPEGREGKGLWRTDLILKGIRDSLMIVDIKGKEIKQKD